MFWVVAVFLPIVLAYTAWVYRVLRGKIQRSQRLLKGTNMWYFSWIPGVGLALALGIINVLWLEADYFCKVEIEEALKERT